MPSEQGLHTTGMTGDIAVDNRTHRCRIAIEFIGEGNDGDYNKDDADDIPLMRFNVQRLYYQGEKIPAMYADYVEEAVAEGPDWYQLADSSYCTRMDARAPRASLKKAAQWLLDQVSEDVFHERRIKKLCQRLSWIEVTQDGRLILEEALRAK